MTSSTDASGRTTKYEYDANGNRTKTTLADLREIKYTYDALNRLTETQYADGSKHTISGNAVETYEAGTFGEPNNSASEFGHQYTGEQWDGDGQFVYLRARWYAPETGRLLSLDPAKGQRRDVRSLNRYSYASMDPVNGRDPSGRETLIGHALDGTAALVEGKVRRDGNRQDSPARHRPCRRYTACAPHRSTSSSGTNTFTAVTSSRGARLSSSCIRRAHTARASSSSSRCSSTNTTR